MKCKRCQDEGRLYVPGKFIKCPDCQAVSNEEWFCGLPTEEKAKRIINIAVNSDCDYRTIVEWLKEKHNG